MRITQDKKQSLLILSVLTSAIVVFNESGLFIALPPIGVMIRNEPSPLVCATGGVTPIPHLTSLNKRRPLPSGVLSNSASYFVTAPMRNMALPYIY